MEKPFSQACENNKQPILNDLQRVFLSVGDVLEVGSGTGQHAVHFAKAMPHLQWYTSDLPENHGGIRAWLDDEPLDNLHPPQVFDVNANWPTIEVDAVYTANTLHIMSWQSVQAFFSGLPNITRRDALLVVYGPFNYRGQYTSDSNARFDEWLKNIDPQRGIRDFEAVDQLANQAGFQLDSDRVMPANNRLLVWRKANRD